MAKGRGALGLVAGVVIILSSGAHSLLGWPALQGLMVFVIPGLLLAFAAINR